MNTYTGCESLEEQLKLLIPVAEKLPGAVTIHDIHDWTVVWMSDYGLKGIKSTLEEIVSLSAEEYYSRFFNEEDSKDYVPKILGPLGQNNDEEIVTYFQQLRISGQSDWSWHMIIYAGSKRLSAFYNHYFLSY